MSRSGGWSSAFLMLLACGSARAEEPLALLERLRGVVEARGEALSNADLIPFLSGDYLKDGFGREYGAAECASVLRSLGGASVNASAKPIHGGRVEFAGPLGSGSVVKRLEADRYSLCSLRWARKGPDGRWLFDGNRQAVRVSAHAAAVVKRSGDPYRPERRYRSVRFLVSAPRAVARAASVVVDGKPRRLEREGKAVLEISLRRAGAPPLEVWTEHFSWEWPEGKAVPETGTVFEFEATLASGKKVRHTDTVGVWASGPGELVEPKSHELAGAAPGGALRVAWKAPDFRLASVELVAMLRVDGALCEVDTDPYPLPPTATEGLIRIPATCGGKALAPNPSRRGEPPVSLTLIFSGEDGRESQIQHPFW